MEKKIVAIGGGENGRILEDGKRAPYNTKLIDKEIVNLAKKEQPNFLFINHAMKDLNIQDSYFNTMQKIYGKKLGCNCQDLKSNELSDIDLVKSKVEWADIIYEGGGDTELMIKLWKESGFDNILYEAWNEGKVICGISAGAVCWFNSCNSDSEESFKDVKCLNWIDLFITPHADETGRIKSSKEQLKNNNKVGIMISNQSALEIIDDSFRVILENDNCFVKKAYYVSEKYVEDKITNSKFLSINELVNKND